MSEATVKKVRHEYLIEKEFIINGTYKKLGVVAVIEWEQRFGKKTLTIIPPKLYDDANWRGQPKEEKFVFLKSDPDLCAGIGELIQVAAKFAKGM